MLQFTGGFCHLASKRDTRFGTKPPGDTYEILLSLSLFLSLFQLAQVGLSSIVYLSVLSFLLRFGESLVFTRPLNRRKSTDSIFVTSRRSHAAFTAAKYIFRTSGESRFFLTPPNFLSRTPHARYTSRFS